MSTAKKLQSKLFGAQAGSGESPLILIE